MSLTLKTLLHEEPIIVTGLGVYSAAGCTATDFFDTLLQGRSRAAFTEVAGRKIAVCRAPDVDPGESGLQKFAKHDRTVKMALVAANQAWQQARLDSIPVAPERIAVFVGSSRSAASKMMEGAVLQEDRPVPPSLMPNSAIAAPSGALGQFFKTRGPAVTLSATCASAGHAIALAAQQILLGIVDVAIAGGSDAPLLPSLLLQMEAAGVLGKHESAELACRPFSACRNGTILGEGAGFLILESSRSARRRGVTGVARLAGWSTMSDEVQRTSFSKNAEGTRHNLMAALDIAGMTAGQIGYFHAHGTGTVLNDLDETRALRQVFPAGVPFSSTKPITGHSMGASTAMGAIAAILAMQRGVLPPSANRLSPDPVCEPDQVLTEPKRASIAAAMINSSGFWGTSAVLIFARPPATTGGGTDAV